jgi:hypothetical protein
MEATPHLLGAWESFYVIVGSAGAALTGLQFVAIAIIAGEGVEASSREVSAFGTPTVVHFCGALLVSAILSAPWHSLSKVSLALSVCGLAGVSYSVTIIRRAKANMTYKPVFVDWLWFVILPILAYALLLISAGFLVNHPHRTLFLVGAAVLLLLFIGIHNAWDGVTYIALEHVRIAKEPEEKVDSE